MKTYKQSEAAHSVGFPALRITMRSLNYLNFENQNLRQRRYMQKSQEHMQCHCSMAYYMYMTIQS